jgi:hypothetical protein
VKKPTEIDHVNNLQFDNVKINGQQVNVQSLTLKQKPLQANTMVLYKENTCFSRSRAAYMWFACTTCNALVYRREAVPSVLLTVKQTLQLPMATGVLPMFAKRT